ncbi:MAG: MarR family winged helix-turn-helix transcriptional regulator [Janthinobacterium lividum]
MRNATVTVAKTPLSRTAKLAAELRPSILRLSRHLRREAQRGGSSSLDAQLLGTLREEPGLGVSELAEMEQMSRPAMSAHIKRLMQLGYVQREGAKADSDRRRIGLSVTRSGTAYLRTVSERRVDWLAERLGELGAEDRTALDRAAKSLRLILQGNGELA